MIKLEYAKQLMNENKIDESLEILCQLIKDYPKEESILFELGKAYEIKCEYKKSIECLEQLLDSENFKDLVYAMLIDNYKEGNEHLKIFNLYKKMQKENKKIKDNNKKNIVIDAIKCLKKYDENISELFYDNEDNLKIFYFSFVNDTLQSLKNENNCDIRFNIYKGAINILKNRLDILTKLNIFENISTAIYLDLEKYLKYLNSLNKIEEVKFMYYKLKNIIPKYEKKIRNALFNEYEISKRRIVFRSFPRVIEFALTNKCNLKCVMCGAFNNAGDFTISDQKIEDLIELMPYLEELILRGGEVLVDKRIDRILEEAKKNKIWVDLITNGTLLNEKNIKEIIDLKIDLTLSIDSIVKEKYEEIRFGAKFEKLMSNIELLTKINNEKKTNVSLALNMVVMPINYMEIESIIEFANKYNFKRVQLLPSIISRKKQYRYKLTKEIVDILAQNKHIYSSMAEKYGIVLINKLPETITEDCNIDFIDDDCECVDQTKESISEKQINKNIDETKGFKLEENIEEENKDIDFNINIENKNCICKSIDIDYKNKLFCLEPFRKIVVDNGKGRPSCLCKAIDYIDRNLKIKNNSILTEWNNITFRKYRESIILNKQNEICLKDCLDNIFINNSK